MSTYRVPRPLRLVNVLALLLLLLGAALYIWAWLGLHGLESYSPPVDAEPMSGMARFDRFWKVSRIGIWLVWSGLGVGVVSAMAALMIRRRR